MRQRIFSLALLIVTVVAHPFAAETNAGFQVSGKAVDAVTGQPLSHVEVSIGEAQQLDVTLQRMLTGKDGRFAFTGMPPGKYWLAGQKNRFRRQTYEQHGSYMSAIVVGKGIVSDNLVFRLRPDAWIEGAITNDENEAVAEASVLLFRVDARAGFKMNDCVAQTISDDRGHYRFPHLEAGWYIVVVSAQPWFGRFVSAPREAGTELPTAENSLFDVAYPTAFYPAGADSALASPLAVNEGERATADLTLTSVPGLRLRIHYPYSDDSEKSENASLREKVFGFPLSQSTHVSTKNDKDNSAEFRGLPPGKYLLDMQSYSRNSSSARSTIIELLGNMEINAGSAESAAIRGVIQTNGRELLPQALLLLWNGNTGEIRVPQLSKNGAFSLDSNFLEPGTYSVFVMNGGESIISKLSATGAKVAGQSIHVSDSKPINLSIELSQTLSTINGTALRNGQPVPGAMIVLAPENPESNLPLFRRDQSDSDGTFTLRDVLPGHYKMVAVEDGWDNLEWANPATLKAHVAHGKDLDVRPNMTYQVDVTPE
jgi:hypothetical protein